MIFDVFSRKIASFFVFSNFFAAAVEAEFPGIEAEFPGIEAELPVHP